MRLVYFGTPTGAVPALRALHADGHDIPLVVTQPDRRRGRGSATSPSPVKEVATELGLPVRTPTRAVDVAGEVSAVDADLGVVVAFGQLLPTAVLESCRHGFVNLHFSLLPRWRGAAPVERAVLAGDEETGVCVMALDEGLDTGPVYDCIRTAVAPEETAGELRARLIDLGTALLVQTVPRLERLTARPQEGEATHAPKLSVEEFRLDPRCPAAELARLVRAGNPRPGAWATVDGRRLKVLRARAVEGRATGGDERIGRIDREGMLATGDGILVLEEVQPEGRAVMAATAWRAGVHGDDPTLDPPA
ncbi:MAG TPA: methionyl-tRNA formyltransferase [Acidimicrobiia bacterium]|nr:methionyl-tRNA formyltransferase [Acidimicrobiia bacterium]